MDSQQATLEGDVGKVFLMRAERDGGFDRDPSKCRELSDFQRKSED